jgi:hypothetical protein
LQLRSELYSRLPDDPAWLATELRAELHTSRPDQPLPLPAAKPEPAPPPAEDPMPSFPSSNVERPAPLRHRLQTTKDRSVMMNVQLTRQELGFIRQALREARDDRRQRHHPPGAAPLDALLNKLEKCRKPGMPPMPEARRG